MTAAAADGLENSASLVKTRKPSLVDKRAIGDELFALGYDVGIDPGGWAFLQDGGGTLEYDEAVLLSPFLTSFPMT
jgi:hypothetical protein